MSIRVASLVGAEPADISCLRSTVMSPMLVSDQRAGKHSCTLPSGMYVTVAPGQQPCLYTLHTISMHVCYSLILSASMYVTFVHDHLPCL